MYNPFLFSVAIIAQLLSVSIPQAIEEPYYVVPTQIEATQEGSEDVVTQFQWQLVEEVRSELAVPRALDQDHGPETSAQAAIVLDEKTQRILWQKNADRSLPIASITKLMTSLVWLQERPADGLEHIHSFAPEEDTPEGKELDLPHGSELSANDLLHIALISSDNDAALGLAATTELPRSEFVKKMNEKARRIGMKDAQFVDPTGLNSGNRATVADVAQLARVAFAQEEIAEVAGLPDYSFRTRNDDRAVRVYTTNKLLADPELEIIDAKTGYIPEAGYCIVAKIRVPNSDRAIVVAVLDTPYPSARFEEAKKIALWAFDHYTWVEK